MSPERLVIILNGSTEGGQSSNIGFASATVHQIRQVMEVQRVTHRPLTQQGHNRRRRYSRVEQLDAQCVLTVVIKSRQGQAPRALQQGADAAGMRFQANPGNDNHEPARQNRGK
ncbi:hypothetical protein D3C77_505880 [compost metagenome]